MKRYLTLIFIFVFLLSFTACKTDNIGSAEPSRDFFSEIMNNPSEYPQLTKTEFIEITNGYLSTGEWTIPSETACFYTSGINSSSYIIENDYLFTLHIRSNDAEQNEFWLSHFEDGIETDTETDPKLFKQFLNSK